MGTALTIAIAAAIFGVFVFIDVLRANRALPFFRPASPEPDEHESGDVQSEIDWRVAAQVRAIHDFHAGLNLTTREHNHGA